MLGVLCEEYHPKQHDNSNISRCEAEANKLKKKVETINKDTIAAHDDSLFNERTGKLQTGLTYHHKFNSDTLHLISTGIQNNIAQLIENLESASKKYKATYSIGSKTNVSKSRRKKEDKNMFSPEPASKPGGVLPYIRYIGMCRPKGHGF